MNNTLGLDFFCEWAGFGMIPAILFIFVQIISKLDRIDLIKKKILFIQIILFVLIISSIIFFKKEIKIFKFLLSSFNNHFNFTFIFFVKNNDLSSNNISFIF